MRSTIDGAERDIGPRRDLAHLHRVISTFLREQHRGLDDSSSTLGLLAFAPAGLFH